MFVASSLFFLTLAFRVPFCTEDLFTYDSADYIRAIHGGFWPQYTGADSIPVTSFLKTYRDNPHFREHPWGLIYQTNDGASLRHFHVPLAFYLPTVVDKLGWGRRCQRLLIAGISSLTVAIVSLILTGAGVSGFMAFAAGLLLSLSPVLVLAGTALSPHALFSATALVCVFSLCRWIETQARRWLTLFALAFGCSIATLELTPLLTVVIIVVLGANWSKLGMRGVLRACGALLASAGIAIVLWPGGLIRGGYLMSYGVFIFQGLFRSSLYFRQRDFPTSVYRLGHGDVLGALLVALLLIASWAAWRVRRSVLLGGFAFFAVMLFAQGIANGFRNPTYASHAVFAIVLTATLGSHLLLKQSSGEDRWIGRATVILMGVLAVGNGFALWSTAPAEVMEDSRRVAGAIASVRTQFPPGTQFVVTEDPQAFITNAPEYHFAGAASVDSLQPEPWVRLDRYYLLFDQAAAKLPADVHFCSPGRLKDFGYLVSCNAI